MTTQQILKDEFDLLAKELIQKYDEKGMRASGKWADELEVVSSPLSVVLLGLDYSQQLEAGRRANNGSSGTKWENSLADIEQWIQDKGIKPIEDKMKISTLAFLIARKIAREGWNRQGYGGVELISEVVTDERIQSILDKLSDAYLIEVSTDIIKQFQTLEVA